MSPDIDALATHVVLLMKTALGPVLERLAALEAWKAMLGDIRDRVIAAETKALQPVFTLPPEAGLDDLRDRLKALELRAEGPSPTDMALVDLRERFTTLERRVGDDTLAKELGTLRERVAVVEVRPALPGPTGEPGPPGRDGVDGAPGLSFEGVYQEGKHYEPGQMATWAGSAWHCNEATTTKPGDGSKAWTLMVKRGRDGKDGRDAVGALPVVSVGGSR